MPLRLLLALTLFPSLLNARISFSAHLKCATEASLACNVTVSRRCTTFYAPKCPQKDTRAMKYENASLYARPSHEGSHLVLPKHGFHLRYGSRSETSTTGCLEWEAGQICEDHNVIGTLVVIGLKSGWLWYRGIVCLFEAVCLLGGTCLVEGRRVLWHSLSTACFVGSRRQIHGVTTFLTLSHSFSAQKRNSEFFRFRNVHFAFTSSVVT